MKTTTKRSLSLLGSILFLIAALVIYANFIRSAYIEALALRGTLNAKTNLLTNQKTIIAQVQGLIAQYQGTSKLQDTISLALPNGEEVAPIFQQINAIAKGNGLSIQTFNLNLLALKPAPVKLSFVRNLGTIQVTLKLFGPYQNIKNFLKGLETNVRVMDLVDLRIENAGSGKNESLHNYTVVFDTYYQN